MELIALRFVFSGRNSFGKPEGSPLNVAEKEAGVFVAEQDGYWEIKTHDRGDDPAAPSYKYFQITFRLLATEEEKDFYRVAARTEETGVNQLEYDEENDLWYQKTWFNKKGLPEGDVYRVDSITTAGVFEVQVIDKRTGMPSITKTVQVMPSSITKAEYQIMLDKLLEVHERLILSPSSMVGIGMVSGSDSVFDTCGEWDYALWEKLKPLIKAIMKIPSDLLRKDYSLMPKERLQRFDSRVMRSLSQKADSNRIYGIVYSGNHDSYENRIIKSFLTKLSQRNIAEPGETIDIEQQLRIDLSNEFYNVDVNSLFTKIRTSESVSGESAERFVLGMKSRRRMYSTGSQRALTIQASYNQAQSKYVVRTNNTYGYYFLHYPFQYNKIDCGVVLETAYADKVLRFMDCISRLFSLLEDGEIPYNGTVTFIGTGKLEHFDVDDYDVKEAYILQLTDFDSVVCSWAENIMADGIEVPDTMVLSQFFLKISEIKGKHRNDYIVINDARQDIIDFVTSRQLRYQKINSANRNLIKQRTVQSEMRAAVHDAWFKQVQLLPHVELPVKTTPKFSYNKYYHSIYELLQKYMELHPLLVSEFDTNAFGLKETWQIYEYWVLSELLNRFTNLGFKTVSGTASIRESLIQFFQSAGQPEGFHVLIQKQYSVDDAMYSIEILLGYNSFVGDQTDSIKGDRHYTPDMFLRIKHNDVYHWYFFDAKYNLYAKGSEDIAVKDLYREIYEVAVYKYIYRMTDQGFLDIMTQQKAHDDPQLWDANARNVVSGSYIIVANILSENENSDSRIADADRLYGGRSSLANQYENKNEKKNVPTEYTEDGRKYYPSVDDEEGYPRHRYGAIQFRPGYEEELTALLEMIFEYKETEQDGLLSRFGEQKTWPANLNLCWDSAFDHTNIQLPRVDPRLTMGGKMKFAVACACGAQRYENHCRSMHGIIKHNLNSYHCRRVQGLARRTMGDKWNYVCPVCGNDLNDEDII